MKPVHTTLVLACLLLGLTTVAQVTLTPEWSKSIGGSGEDRANVIIRTPDNGFLVAGFSKSNDGDVSGHHGALTVADGWVVKLSATGAIEWQRSLGGDAHDEFVAAQVTPDGNYLVAGSTQSTNGDVVGNHGSQDIWLVKLSRQGSVLWQKCYGGSGVELLRSLRPMDNGYAFIGNTTSSDGDLTAFYGGISDIWVGKLDAAYNLSWQKSFGGAQRDEGYDIAGAEDGSLLITAYNPSNPSNLGYWGPQIIDQTAVVKINAAGNVVWFDKVGLGTRGAFPYSLVKGDNNRYFLGFSYTVQCSSPFYITGATNARYTDYDAAATSGSFLPLGGLAPPCPGSTGPELNYSFSNPRALHPLDNANAVMAVGTNDPAIVSPSGGNAVLFGMRAGSGVTWKKAFGGSGIDALVSVTALDEFQIVAAGYSNSNNGDLSGNHGDYDMWVLKLGKANTIKGTVFVDYNANGIRDAGEPLSNGTLVETEKNGAKASTLSFNGAFSNRFDTGTYVTKAISNVPYYSVAPAQRSSAFNTYYNTDSFGFALQPIPGQRDYSVSISTIVGPRPGFTVNQYIEYKNIGTDTLVNRSVKLVKDPRMTFVSALPTPVSVVADTITWNIASLNPRMSGSISVQLTLAQPPTLNINEFISSTVTIDTTGDLKKTNNTATWRQIVVGSFDPNDKLESNGGEISIEGLADKLLTYTIRFQNTGTDTAFNVVIRDTLDAKLDWSSIEMVRASHPYSLLIKDGRFLTWTFSNILLPDSNRNEPASNGYVTFTIKPKAGLVVGDIIRNSASIYFDFNLPIKTNTQETVVKPVAIVVPQPVVSGVAAAYCSVQAVQQGRINNLPASGSGITTTVKLDGNTLAVAADSSFSFDVSALAAGAHVIEVTYTAGAQSKTTTANFTVVAAVTPDFDITALIVQVVSSNPVSIGVVNITGGGTAPAFTFALDRNFTNLLQAEGSNTNITFDPAVLKLGANKLYVRMKTSATCFTQQTVIDSVTITKYGASGFVDPDYPMQRISANPNPFNSRLMVHGINAAKAYTLIIHNHQGKKVFQRRVAGVSLATLHVPALPAGIYTLSVYDETKGQLIGTINIAKQ
jgi:hypothetical protein